MTIVRNENGEVTGLVSPSQSLQYARDDAGRVTRAAVLEGQQEVRSVLVDYDYLADRVNWLEHALAPNVVCRVSYSYFPNGRVATETLAVNQVVRQRLNYQYDGAGDLLSILDDTPGVAPETTQYSYDGAGRMVEQRLANGLLKTVFEYGNPSQPGHGALRAVSHMIPPQGRLLNFGAVIGSYTYTRYPDSRPESAVEWSGSQPTTVQWRYDPYAQLRAENRGGWTNFTYDNGGNLTGIGSRTLTYYTDTNQLASDNGTTSYTYDATGARATRVSGGTTTTYSYDFLGNLTEVRAGQSVVYGAAYDALGQRVQQTVGGQTTYLVYDLYGDLIAEVNSSGALVARYVWGPTGPVYRVASPNTRRYYLHDGLGNVRLLATSSGQVTDRYTYDAWGKPTQTVGTTPNPFRWGGQFGYQYIPQTGLYHVGAREYDPVVARWLQRDPIGVSGGNPNTYVYCNNCPTAYVDPDGAEPLALIDTALDVGSVVFDGLRFALHKAGVTDDPDAGTDLAISVGCMAMPYANAFLMKAAVRGARTLQKVLTPVTKWITCLPAGALVVAAAGMTPVEQLQPGDLVIGRTDAEVEVQARVLRNTSFIADELVAVGLDGREVLQATPSHPVWRVGDGWTQVRELRVGDRLVTRTGEVEVASVSRLSGPALVHNLAVEAPHTYFAGADQVLSHNKVTDWLLKVIRNHYDEGIDALHDLQQLGKGGLSFADDAGYAAGKTGYNPTGSGSPSNPWHNTFGGNPGPQRPPGPPYTHLRYDEGGKIVGGRTFGPDGRAVYDIDIGSRSRRTDHPYPNWHPWDCSKPGSPKRGKEVPGLPHGLPFLWD